MENLYDFLWLLPLFFLWIYISFIIVLYGAILTYVIQNHHTLPKLRLSWQDNRELENLNYRLYFALSGLQCIYLEFYEGKTPTPFDRVLSYTKADKLGMADLLKSTLHVLHEGNILKTLPKGQNIAYTPGYPADILKLNQVLEALHIQQIAPEKHILPQLQSLISHFNENLIQCTTSFTNDQTLTELLVYPVQKKNRTGESDK